MPNARETKTFNLTLLGKTPYLPPNLFTSGKHHDLVRLVFDRLCHPVLRTPSGLALEEYYYLVEARYIKPAASKEDNSFADIWQVTNIALLSEWHAQVTVTKVAHLHDNVLNPIPDSIARSNLLHAMGLQAIAAASLKQP